MKPAYARLHVLLAREAPIGLVIRHGTAKSVCTLLWNRKKDTFALGQWMRGRIETETCDLSPDGAHFLYTARKYALSKLSKYVDPYGSVETWTVVSRAPYLKAVAYYPHRWAGGWFLNRHEYCIPTGSISNEDRESPEMRRVDADPPKPSLYAERLVRGGWLIDDARNQFRSRLEYFRPAGGGWELRYIPQKGYRLSCGEVEADTKDWEWADVDGKRLVWAAKGCLWQGMLWRDGIQQSRLLHDFNGMSFEHIAAPYEGGKTAVRAPIAIKTQPAVAVSRKIAKRPKKLHRRKPDRSKVRPREEE